jgi:hypothetical protein
MLGLEKLVATAYRLPLIFSSKFNIRPQSPLPSSASGTELNLNPQTQPLKYRAQRHGLLIEHMIQKITSRNNNI